MGTWPSGVLVQIPDHLDRFRQGDVDAFEELFRLHQRAVYGWILRIVRNPPAAEDLTVETFWRIYKAHARFEASREFEPWARRIATRAALDWLRARRPEAELTAEVMATHATVSSDPGVTAEIRSSSGSSLSARSTPIARRASCNRMAGSLFSGSFSPGVLSPSKTP